MKIIVIAKIRFHVSRRSHILIINLSSVELVQKETTKPQIRILIRLS